MQTTSRRPTRKRNLQLLHCSDPTTTRRGIDMTTIKGPGVSLAQCLNPQARFDSLASIAHWASSLGFKAVEIPCSSNPAIFDLARATESKVYCDEVRGTLAMAGIEISALSTHAEGQLVAVH